MNQMLSVRQSLSLNPLLRFFASLKITVTCLFLFFLLTFWGTVYQADHGLYAAQHCFFNSFYFLIFNALPFPGGRLVSMVLFINLLAAFIIRFRFLLSKIGILIIHLGIFSFFISSFLTFHYAIESNVHLMEGEATNVSQSYFDWEIAAWETTRSERKQIVAYDMKDVTEKNVLSFQELGFDLILEEYMPNSEAYRGGVPEKEPRLNASGVEKLIEKPALKEPEKNLPGMLARFADGTGKEKKILLFGGEGIPLEIKAGEKNISLKLQKKRYPLPFMIYLSDFRRQMHSGTEIPRSFESTVTIEPLSGKREVIISMNHPLREGPYTFFQASYGIDGAGREYSTFAVVRNAGRAAPYISTFLTFIGLMVHFLSRFWGFVKNQKR